MILINALAIDLEWINQFKSYNTRGNPFYKDNGEEMTAATMYIEVSDNNLSYYTDNEDQRSLKKSSSSLTGNPIRWFKKINPRRFTYKFRMDRR